MSVTSTDVGRDDLSTFVRCLFSHAESGTFVSLRSFDQINKRAPARFIQSIKINGSLDNVIEAAFEAAINAATNNRQWVFAPPICTFNSETHARTQDIANGLTLSVELDSNPGKGQETLEMLLGPVTLAVASGSRWTDPETGELIPNLHLHWRLAKATLTQEDHAKLRKARNLATQLVGGDPTGKPVVHPMRWPGSWNLKDKPILACITEINPDREIVLEDAVNTLQDAADLRGMQSVYPDWKPSVGGSLVDETGYYISAVKFIPNNWTLEDVEPERAEGSKDWMDTGIAICRSSGGSEVGRKVWEEWSRKSNKFDQAEQDAAWIRIKSAVSGSQHPNPISPGTLFFRAKQYGWERPQPDYGMFRQPAPTSGFDMRRPDWRAMLDVTGKRGAPEATIRNAAVPLRSAPEWIGAFAWNEFSQQCIVRRQVPGSSAPVPRELRDTDITCVAMWLQHEGIKVSSGAALEALRVVADENRFHPVREYLSGLTWDGVGRLDNWLIDHMGAEECSLHRALGSKWAIGAVARIMQPGCQMDTALILEARQGLKKSTAFRVLAGEWFTDHIADLTHKDSLEQLQGIWIVELAEISSLRRNETDKIKSFLSTRVDKFRPSYGRVVIGYPRQCVFAGTVNPGSSGYLRDETGARRFWTVAVGVTWDDRQQVDIPALEAVRDQLWAEAVARWGQGEAWWLETAEQESEQAAAADLRSEDDPRSEIIRHFLSMRSEPATMAEILGEDCLNIPVGQWNRSLRTEIGIAIGKAGARKKDRGRAPKGGKRPDPSYYI